MVRRPYVLSRHPQLDRRREQSRRNAPARNLVGGAPRCVQTLAEGDFGGGDRGSLSGQVPRVAR